MTLAALLQLFRVQFLPDLGAHTIWLAVSTTHQMWSKLLIALL